MKCDFCDRDIKKSVMVGFKMFKDSVCKKCEKIFREEIIQKGLDNFYSRVEKECKKK